MAKFRTGRINDEMQKAISAALREVKDPRVRDAFISITGAEVTPDLKYAKIYYSAMQKQEKEVARGLASCSGFLRKQIAQSMNLRQTPELNFVRDNSIAYGAHISELLNSITITPEQTEPEEGESEENA